jgi:polysaccharide pyruvyl transferase WcaK-like protein
VGEAIALRNAWIKAMVNGDEATAIKYEDKMRDLKNHSADEKRVLEYSNVENKESTVKRLIRIFNLSENELKQRVNNYNESQKPWWVFW